MPKIWSSTETFSAQINEKDQSLTAGWFVSVGPRVTLVTGLILVVAVLAFAGLITQTVPMSTTQTLFVTLVVLAIGVLAIVTAWRRGRVAVLLATGLVLYETFFFSQRLFRFAVPIAVQWAAFYIFLVWGAAVFLFLIPFLLPFAISMKRRFDKFSRLAFAVNDRSARGIVSQFLVAALLNALVFDVVFLPGMAAAIAPPLSPFQLNYSFFLKNFWYDVFLGTFAGVVGPSIVFAVRIAKRHKLTRDSEAMVHKILGACYLSIVVGIVVIASVILGVSSIGQPSIRFFLNEYLGQALPSTLAAIAFLNLFELETIWRQSVVVFATALLLVGYGMVIFRPIGQIFVQPLIASAISAVILVLAYRTRTPKKDKAGRSYKVIKSKPQSRVK